MGGLFGTPPVPAPAPPAPALTDVKVQKAAYEQSQLAAQRKGRASTVITDMQSQRPQKKERPTDGLY